ncbi:IS701 family transposase [Allorhizocola rhizosphaerae]|uniref:IS701 family transposase n=1 Tax=Allorhizocola rhizosphaerae TaxID=1872709 RepID=UPI001FEAE00E|nr:IS701 family transposase [Allorhizocola rhizosphaerae]
MVDETGFAKKGTGSAGVARQYSGTLGRIDSCQIGVFVGYVTATLRVLVDRAFYLPRHWVADPGRCAEAGVPEGTQFATKPQLALTMIARTLTAGLNAAWVAADEAYGRDGKFRAGLRALGLGYVVAVACNTQIRQLGQRTRVDVLTRRPASHQWQRYHCGSGSKGPRYYDWAWIAIDGDSPTGQHSLLVRRGSDGTFAYYLTWHPTHAGLHELIAVAGRRWAIEEGFQVTKDQFGLDHYQTRSWQGWHRHCTLTMISHALTVWPSTTTNPTPPTRHT